MMPATERAVRRERLAAGAAIGVVLRDRSVHPLFQPVVELSTRSVVGLEALARGPAGSALEFPDRLFAAAGSAARLAELDMLCIERALECGRVAPVAPPLLFVNAEPAVMSQPPSPRLLELIRAGLPFREVLEYTERALPAVPGHLLRVAGQLQAAGAALAFDDVGVAPASLAFLPVLEPEVIKLDMSLIRDPHGAHARQVCGVVRSEATRTGAVVIAEGIETEYDLAAAVGLGAHWGQGWLFGRPQRIEDLDCRYEAAAAERLRAPRPGFHVPAGTPFAIAAAHGPVTAGTANAVAAASGKLREAVADDNHAIIVASCPATRIPGLAGSLIEVVGRSGSVILVDRPIPDEFTAAVIGAGYGITMSLRTAASGGVELVVIDHLPAVAAIIRSVLSHLARSRDRVDVAQRAHTA